jgi:hypothetical protein
VVRAYAVSQEVDPSSLVQALVGDAELDMVYRSVKLNAGQRGNNARLSARREGSNAAASG